MNEKLHGEAFKLFRYFPCTS